jgi:hypothetical protein
MEVAIVTSSLFCWLPEQVQRYSIKVAPIYGLIVTPRYVARTLFGELFD